VRKLEKDGKKIARVVYAHDRNSGIKLFASAGLVRARANERHSAPSCRAASPKPGPRNMAARWRTTRRVLKHVRGDSQLSK
jgi:hypothetical protein